MQSERSLIKKILFVIKNIGTTKAKMSGIELILNEDGIVIGYKIEIIEDRNKLKLVTNDEED